MRDGLTRAQRIVLQELARAVAERGRDSIPASLLRGRVIERIDMSEAELRSVLCSLGVGDRVRS